MADRALALVSETVALPVSVDEAMQQWNDYQELTRRLLDESDYQAMGQRRFKKKSAWRKYSRAFNISCEKVAEEIVRDERGFPIWARIWMRATAPNGRHEEADHECHVSERCCPNATDMACSKAGWKGHECCKPGCDGKLHWSHPGDLPATATTRAKNRAISDLIGAGEVSAEEMSGQRVEPEGPSTAPARPVPAQAGPGGEHWCKEHGVKFFKSAKMKNYAHPLKEGGWHNEPEAKGEITMREVPAEAPGNMDDETDTLDDAFGPADHAPEATSDATKPAGGQQGPTLDEDAFKSLSIQEIRKEILNFQKVDRDRFGRVKVALGLTSKVMSDLTADDCFRMAKALLAKD